MLNIWWSWMVFDEFCLFCAENVVQLSEAYRIRPAMGSGQGRGAMISIRGLNMER